MSLKNSSPWKLLITCEHASPYVPHRYKSAFAGVRATQALKTHRGYDIGARELARELAKYATLGHIEGEMTRLLIDLNRTRKHPALFSIYSKRLPDEARRELLAVHTRHTEQVEGALRETAPNQRAYHLGVHSFTPVLDGKVRTTDIGLLYDPKRRAESEWVLLLARALRARSDFRIHLNRPYRGVSDGLTTHLRRKFSDKRYAGVELELNQRLLTTKADLSAMRKLLEGALVESLATSQPTR